MDTPTSIALVGLLYTNATLAFLFVYLNAKAPTAYLKFWAAAYSVAAAAMTNALAFFFFLDDMPPGPLHGTFMTVSALFLMAGAYRYIDRTLPKWWFALVGASMVAAGALKASGASEFISALPPTLILGVAHITVGVMLWRRSPQRGSAGLKMAVVGLVLSGLHILDYPFTAHFEHMLPWGSLLMSFLALITGIGFVLMHLDRTAEALRRSEARFRSMFINATEGLFRADPEGHLIDVNPALVALLGAKDPESLIGTSIQALDSEGEGLPEPHSERRVAELSHRQWQHQDGPRVVVDVRARLGEGTEGEGPVYNGFVRDLSAEEALREHLVRSETLHAVGRLAGGLAHDFNGLLTIIRLAAALVKDTFDEDDERSEDMDNIIQTTERAAGLTRQLLEVRGQQPQKTSTFQLNEQLSSLSNLIAGTCPSDVIFSLVLNPEVGWVEAEPTSLDRAVLNLIRNALDAMPSGGKLKVQTGPCSLGSPDGEPGWQIEVIDTGIGMSKDMTGAARKPFFSTKEAGSGLGLAVVQRVVERAGGLFELISVPGEGTRALIKLPASSPKQSVEAPSPPLVQMPHGEAIVVVDDDEAIREMVARVLVRLGRPVLTAGSFDEALAFLDKGVEPALLITDVLMPEHNGRELADAVRERAPNVPVLYISGFSADILDQRGLLTQGVKLLSKPLDLDVLVKAAEEALRSGKGVT